MSTLAVKQVTCFKETSWTYDNVKMRLWTPQKNVPRTLNLGTFNEGEQRLIPLPFERYRVNFAYDFPVYIRLIDVDDCSSDDIIGDVEITEAMAISHDERSFKLPRFNLVGDYELVVQLFFDTKTASEIQEMLSPGATYKKVKSLLSRSKSSRDYWNKRPHEEYVTKCTEIYQKVLAVMRKDPDFNLNLIVNPKTKEIHTRYCSFRPKKISNINEIDIHQAFDYAINRGFDFCGKCIGGLDRR